MSINTMPVESSELIATRIIREHAATHLELKDARHALIPRPEGYVHDFGEVYLPPTLPSPDAETITYALNAAIGEHQFASLVDTLAGSESTEEALSVAKEGGKVALMGAHRELFDTCAMQAGFLVAADRIEPGVIPELIQGNRIFVGPIMAELALKALSEELSTIDALRLLGGVFKMFPMTQATQDNIKKGLDPELVQSVNIAMIQAFKRQSRQGELHTVAVAPSGSVDKLQDTADGMGQEYLLRRVSSATGKLFKDFAWLPVAMQLSPRAAFRVGELVVPSPERDIHQFMGSVLVPLCCELNAEEGIATRYEEDPQNKPD